MDSAPAILTAGLSKNYGNLLALDSMESCGWNRARFSASGTALLVAIPALLGWPGFVLGKVFVEFDVGNWPLMIATLNMLPLVFIFLGLALLMSALMANRGAAAGITTGILVVFYFVHTLASAVQSLHEVRKLTPFYWADSSWVFIHGFSWARFLVMLAIAVALVALAAWRFERRDVALGSREWRLLSFARRRHRPEDTLAHPGHPEATAGGD